MTASTTNSLQMHLLTLSDYLSTPNSLSGITKEREASMVKECLLFIQYNCQHFHIGTNILGTALTILHKYLKRHPFTEFDRFMLSSVCLQVACKIDYFKISNRGLMEIYFH